MANLTLLHDSIDHNVNGRHYNLNNIETFTNIDLVVRECLNQRGFYRIHSTMRR